MKEKKNLLLSDFFSIFLVLFGRKLYCVSNQPEILSLALLCGNLITHQVFDSLVSTIGFFFLQLSNNPSTCSFSEICDFSRVSFQKWSVKRIFPPLKTSPYLPTSLVGPYLIFCLLKGYWILNAIYICELYVQFTIF